MAGWQVCCERGVEFGLECAKGRSRMNLDRAEQKRMVENVSGARSDIDRKFWAALAMFAVLAVVVWLTMGDGSVPVFGRPVELKLIPLIVIGGLVLRMVLARKAEKIRRGSD